MLPARLERAAGMAGLEAREQGAEADAGGGWMEEI